MDEHGSPLTVISLEAQNVQRLRAVRIDTAGAPLVVLGGRNAQGKSSVLDALCLAIGGKRWQGAQPVRDGADAAEVRLDLGPLVVHRTVRANGTTQLTVTGHDGAKYASPQAVLDRLYGELAFDPLAFARAKPKDQVQTLATLCGVDLDAHAAERRRLYDERTAVGRVAREAEARLAAAPPAPAVPPDAPDVSALAATLAQIDTAWTAHVAAQRDTTAATAAVATLATRIGALERDLADLRAQHAAALTAVAAAQAHEAGLAEEVATLPARATVAAALAAAQAAIQAQAAAEAQAAQRAQDAQAAAAAHAQVEALTAQIAAHDGALAAAVAAAAIPVPDLALTPDGVLYQGRPLASASSAELLRVSTALALAQHPRLRVALIRDGSLLDADSLALVADIARAAGAQVWVERVGSGPECTVVLEDGEVVP